MPSWAGPYLGVQAGYLSAGGETTFPGTDEFHFVDPKGFAGGFMAGTARQWGRVVGGVEGDLSFVAAKATLDTGFAPDPSVSQLQTTINWNSHLRGRLGYGFDNALLFVAGGLALAGVENKAFDNAAGVTATWNDTRVGWTIGGGVDYRVAPTGHGAARISLRQLRHQDACGADRRATTFAERDHKLDTHTLARRRELAFLTPRRPTTARVPASLAKGRHNHAQDFCPLHCWLPASAADAAPMVGAGSIRVAAAAAAPVQTVACARYGWRGWGVYPGCFRPRYYAPGYVVAAPYYAPPPVYVAPAPYIGPPRRCWIAGAWRPC